MKILRLLIAVATATSAWPAASTVVVDEPLPQLPQRSQVPLPRDGGLDRPPDGDPLGDVWEMEEVAQWRGVWMRRGNSPIFDGYWTHPSGERVRVPVEIRVRGRSVTVLRGHGGGESCTYVGRIARGWVNVAGTYTCSWERTPMNWRAQIVRMGDVTPAILRPGYGYGIDREPEFEVPARRLGRLPIGRLDEVSYLRFNSGLTDPLSHVVRSPMDWALLWRTMAQRGGPARPVPGVDFERSLVLVAASGTKATGGHSISIEQVSDAGAEILVEVERGSPGAQCGVTAALTQPADVAVVPRSDKPVRWVYRDLVRDC